MDLNLVLLWMASATCVAVAMRVLALRSRQGRQWLAVCGAVLAAEGALQLVWPERAGFVGAALCALFVIVPLYAGAGVTRLCAQRRFGAARWLAHVLRVLHPSRAFREFPGYIDALERLHRGELDAADLPAIAPSTPLGRSVRVQALRSACRFGDLLAFLESLPDEIRRADSGLALAEVRALAEVGAIDSLLERHARIESVPALVGARDPSRLIVAARLGRVDLVERLLQGPVARALPADGAAFWRATALQVAGDARAQPLLEQLARADAETARAARHRLAAPLPRVELAALSVAAQQSVQQLERELESAQGLVESGSRSPACALLLASLVVAFLAELPGGATDPSNLVDLGALAIGFPPSLGGGEPWRLLSAAFLHYGATHLIMNVLGLWVLGRPVEAILGPQRLVALFVISAVGGNLAAKLLLHGPTVLVGASGGVLGLLGALLAITLRRFRRMRTRFLRSQLRGSLFVIAIQVFFDLSMPAISSTAHVGGFAAGLLLGLVMSPERRGRLTEARPGTTSGSS